MTTRVPPLVSAPTNSVVRSAPFSVKAVCRQIRQGHLFLSGVFLRDQKEDALRRLRGELERTEQGIRVEPLPPGNLEAIRRRGERISRVRAALLVLESLLGE